MRAISYCVFETALGTCGIAWREPVDPVSQPAVVLFQLPEVTAQKTESRIAARAGSGQPSIAPPRVAELIEKIQRHLRGEVQDFRDVAVELNGVSEFDLQVYEAARGIPAGQTRTYGEIARALGQPAAARDVGQALSKNPVPLIVPCHRISAADGKLGGFSAPGGRATKSKLLALEGAPVTPLLFS